MEAVARDITTRVAAEQALRASEQRYRSLFERNLAGVYRTTLEGRIVECNDAFARVLGYASGAEVRGLSAGDLYPMPALRQAFVERLLSEGTLVNQESEGRRKDGASVWMLENAALVREEGGPYVEGTIVDITERKNLERQLGQAQKMEAVGQLAGGVVHDFSNILSVIGGYSELAVKRTDEHSPLRPYLDEIRRAAGRATDLVRQLLAFSRGQIVEPSVLDLDEVVRGLEEMLRRLIPENIELVTSLRASPALVKADRGQLEQVIVNLAVNARDAMPRGGRLAIETTRTDLDQAYCRRHVGTSPGPHVMLAVTDTGIGMDAETQARIFEPFFTTKEPGRGTGLGLATVYGIVRRAGGSIWVYSEPGRGTVFKTYLPQVEGEVETAEPGGKAGAAPAVPRGTETILLVEDEEALRALARELLESLGYTVLDARHGAEALEVSAAHGEPYRPADDRPGHAPHRWPGAGDAVGRRTSGDPRSFRLGLRRGRHNSGEAAGEPRGVPAEALHGGGPRDENPLAPGPALGLEGEPAGRRALGGRPWRVAYRLESEPVSLHWLSQGMADAPADDAWLSPREASWVARMRFPKRRSEFRLGRWTAKRALALYLGREASAGALRSIEIDRAPDGAPAPLVDGRPAEAYVTMTDRADQAVCLVGPPGTALGCDLELVEPRSDAFVADYLTPVGAAARRRDRRWRTRATSSPTSSGAARSRRSRCSAPACGATRAASRCRSRMDGESKAGRR